MAISSSVSSLSSTRVHLWKRLSRFLFTWDASRRRNVVLSGTAVSLFTLGVACSKRVPAGHVGLLEDWNGNVSANLFDDESVYFYVPFYQKPILLRLFPVKKRLIKILKTKDGKDIEVTVEVRLQPKIAFSREIYCRFGRDYGKGFVEREAAVDMEEVVKQFTLDELLHVDEAAEEATDELTRRLNDACAFHRLILSETAVIFKDPLDNDDNEEREEEEEEEQEIEAREGEGRKEEAQAAVRSEAVAR